MIQERPSVAITIGDAAGIGPEILLKCFANKAIPEFCIPIAFGNAKILEANQAIAGTDLEIRTISDVSEARGEPGTVDVIECGSLGLDEFEVGEGNAATGTLSAISLKTAIETALAGKVDAVIMGPTSKHAQNLAGYKFAGFRETANHFAGCDDTVLITLGKNYNLTRVTTHVPLADVPRLCSRAAVLEVIRQTDRGMKAIGYERPRIGISGLNPHCGEDGLLGREEIEQIIPAIEDARAEDIEALGPYPGDAIFIKQGKGEFDVLVSMYHDHGNACIKLVEFGSLVNLLAGAPVPILTVHHGTAFDIAGQGIASESTLRCSIYVAAKQPVPDWA